MSSESTYKQRKLAHIATALALLNNRFWLYFLFQKLVLKEIAYIISYKHIWVYFWESLNCLKQLFSWENGYNAVKSIAPFFVAACYLLQQNWSYVGTNIYLRMYIIRYLSALRLSKILHAFLFCTNLCTYINYKPCGVNNLLARQNVGLVLPSITLKVAGLTPRGYKICFLIDYII